MTGQRQHERRQDRQKHVDTAELLSHVRDGVLALSRDTVVTYANAAAARILAPAGGELVGRALPLPLPVAGEPGDGNGSGADVVRALRRVLQQRRPATFRARLGQDPRWYEIRALPTPAGLVAYLRDVEPEQRAEGLRLELAARLHRSDEHSHRLHELTRALAGALTTTDVAETVTAHLRRAMKPLLAGVAMLEESGTALRLLSASPLPPAGSTAWAELPLAGSTPAAEVVRQRDATFRERPDASALLPLAGGDGAILGVLSVTWRGQHPLSAPDRDFLGIVAGQTAQALERALLARRHSAAAVLQQAALPTSLPAASGWQLAARYLPGVGGAGGQWYDAFTGPDGRLSLIVGDASGRGLATAGTMNQLRHAARAYALLGDGPAATLRRLDQLLSGIEPDAIATLACLELDPGTGSGRWACAGHSPPLLVHPGGWRVPAGDDIDPPLGCLGISPAREHQVTVAAGETVLLLAAGLVRPLDDPFHGTGGASGPGQDADPGVGLSVLGRAAGGRHPAEGPDALDELLDGTLRAVLDGVDPLDDVCLMAARRASRTIDLKAVERPDRHLRLRRTLRPLPQAAGEARTATREALGSWGLDGLSNSATLVVSELVTNAVTHARSVITLDVEADGDTVTVSVTDTSHDPPRPQHATATDERGRGVQLVDVLCVRWGTDHLPTGKRVWAELSAEP